MKMRKCGVSLCVILLLAFVELVGYLFYKGREKNNVYFLTITYKKGI